MATMRARFRFATIVSLAMPGVVASEWLAVLFGALLLIAPWVSCDKLFEPSLASVRADERSDLLSGMAGLAAPLFDPAQLEAEPAADSLCWRRCTASSSPRRRGVRESGRRRRSRPR